VTDEAREAAEQARRERAAARASRVTIVRTTLGAEDRDGSVRGPEAIALAVKLSRAAWSLAGREWPHAARVSVPFAFVPRSPVG